MFGLMKPLSCGKSEKNKLDSKINYCGVCKSIGSTYSQKARMLLNNDIVFLGEILSAISKENMYGWNLAYQSKNCFSMPSKAEIPLSLQFASGLNIILSELKFNDNISDSLKTKYLWKTMKAFFSNDLKKASKKMYDWGIDIKKFFELINTQKEREQSNKILKTPKETLEYFSESTNIITAISFQQGGLLVDKKIESENMYNLGYFFGKLIYIMDALEDFTKDYKEKNFNAIRKAYNINNQIEIDIETKEKVLDEILLLKENVIGEINKLEINEKIKKQFSHRLISNINKKLGFESSKICKISFSKNNNFNIDLSKENKSTNNNKNNSTQKENKKGIFCLEWLECLNCCDCCTACDCAAFDCASCDCCTACECCSCA